MAELLNGRVLADDMQSKLRDEVEGWKKRGLRTPKLVVLLVGNDVGSEVYVRNKETAAKKIGIASIVEKLPESITEKELLDKVHFYNEDEEVDGILVQLPLPAHINEETILLAINEEKDVDGFHPMSLGRLAMGNPKKIPCTPYGIMELLESKDITIAGKHAVIVGRSNIVGKPMAQLLLNNDATVTITHSKTVNLKEITKEADILVVAIGQSELITKDYVKPGAIVIDVGMNRHADGHLVGDVNFKEVKDIASFITPVPGGVGPMTITMLMEQTVARVREEHEDR